MLLQFGVFKLHFTHVHMQTMFYFCFQYLEGDGPTTDAPMETEGTNSAAGQVR